MTQFLPNAPQVTNDLKQDYYWVSWFQQLWKSYTRNQNVAAVQLVAFTPSLENYYYPCDTTGGAFAVTFPLSLNNRGKKLAICHKTSANALTLVAGGADAFYPAAPGAIPVGTTNVYIADGISTWYKVSIS